MSAVTLESLTNELFECVVSYLCLNDIRDLRLASRSTAYKATQDRFKYFLKARHVDLTRSGLHSFVRSTSHSQLGCLVEDLSLVGVVYNPFGLENITKNGYWYATEEELKHNPQLQGKPIECNEEEIRTARADLETLRRSQEDDEVLQKQGDDVALLKEAFGNLANRRQHGLQRLSLEIVVYRNDATTRLPPTEGRCWRWILKAASRTFDLVISCLRDSGLPIIEALDVFHKKPKSLACTVPCDALTSFAFDSASFSPVVSYLKTLSISIGDPVILENEFDANYCGDPDQKVHCTLLRQKRDLAPLQAHISDETSYWNLAKLVHLCQDLSDLDLSGYRLGQHGHDLRDRQRMMRAQYVHYLSCMPPLPHLRKLRLAGLPVKDHELVTFLNNHRHSLKAVGLNNVSIDRGSFKPVFSCMTGGDMDLKIIHLEDLGEDDGIVQFSGELEQDFTTISGDYHGRNVTRRWGEGTKRQILYRFRTGRSMDTARIRVWRYRRELEFGGR